ncbi:MAG TPA: homocysteine S-methyltransferase family protein [Ignavibacteriaceae bacterium]|nr:homocysteine S-methyltransferase family protein [Ignavibacteriaceae bacterium]
MIKNDINIFSLCKRIGRPLILDGAMGSLLQKKGFKPDGPMWMSLLNLKNPEAIYKIHREYISAGADIITTNTFRTNPAAVKHYLKVNVKSLVKKSLDIALEAAKNLPVFVAGSNAPAEDCYQAVRTISKKELRKNHEVHIDLLIESGCHFIINETQSHFDEIKIICNYCYKNEIPYVISLFFKEDLKLLSGEDLKEIIKYITDKNPLAVGLNCVTPSVFLKAVKKISPLLKYCNWGFYLNLGGGAYSDEIIKCEIDPEDYSGLVKEYLQRAPSFVGACCGSSPRHIKYLWKIINES